MTVAEKINTTELFEQARAATDTGKNEGERAYLLVEKTVELMAPRIKDGSIDRPSAREELATIATAIYRDMTKPIEDALDGKISKHDVSMPATLRTQRKLQALKTDGNTALKVDGLEGQTVVLLPARHQIQSSFESAAVSSYTMRGIQWLWPNRFALGKIALIGGLPDRGKGLIASDMIARVTKGRNWPCGEGRAIQGNVLLLTAEDDIADTVVPRLVAAEADLDRVHILKMVRRGDKQQMFSLVTDLDLLAENRGDRQCGDDRY
jgi:hypothetical protein